MSGDASQRSELSGVPADPIETRDGAEGPVWPLGHVMGTADISAPTIGRAWPWEQARAAGWGLWGRVQGPTLDPPFVSQTILLMDKPSCPVEGRKP